MGIKIEKRFLKELNKDVIVAEFNNFTFIIIQEIAKIPKRLSPKYIFGNSTFIYIDKKINPIELITRFNPKESIGFITSIKNNHFGYIISDKSNKSKLKNLLENYPLENFLLSINTFDKFFSQNNNISSDENTTNTQLPNDIKRDEVKKILEFIDNSFTGYEKKENINDYTSELDRLIIEEGQKKFSLNTEGHVPQDILHHDFSFEAFIEEEMHAAAENDTNQPFFIFHIEPPIIFQ